MRTAKLLVLLTLSGVLLLAGNGRGRILGNVANPDGTVRIDATSLTTGERFTSVADANGGFTLASLPPGSYRVVIHNAAGTASARRLLKVRAGETLRLNARLEAVRPPRRDAWRHDVHRAVAAAAADVPPVVQQFGESSRDLNAVVLVDDNKGWAVGNPRWDQATHQIKGTIINTTDGGATWINQDPGVAAALYGVSFVNASQGWAAGDNGTIVQTADGGAHWTRQPVSTGDNFLGIFFADALNGWATSYAFTQFYDFVQVSVVGWRATVWHTTDGGQTWAPQTIPSSAMVLTRVFFVDSRTGFAAGFKQAGYDGFDNPIPVGAIYGTTDGGHTWNEVFATDYDFTFTALDFTDANNGWASGYTDYACDRASAYHTADGGKTWQPQNLDTLGCEMQVRDLHMIDTNRGYAVGTYYSEPPAGTAVWRTLDGGTTWTRVIMENMNPLDAEGYWGVAATANRVRIVGDRDITAFSWNPWNACAATPGDCSELFTQAYITPHYAFHDICFIDRIHGWAAGTRTFSPQLWGQEIFATQDGGQTWTSQFERSQAYELYPNFRLDSISFADANNGWASGSSAFYADSSGMEQLRGCILHTADGGKTWTDQGANICMVGIATEYSVIQFLDAQNGWALAQDAVSATVELAHSTDGGNHWALVDTGVPGAVGVGYATVQGAMHFSDAQHGCVAGWQGAGCTTDGGLHWKAATIACPESNCFLDSNGVALADSNNLWISGGSGYDGGVLYQSGDGGASFSLGTPPALADSPLGAIRFPNASTGWIAAGAGLLYQSTDAGADWQSVNTGISADLYGLNYPDPTHGWIAGDFGTILSYAGDRTAAGVPAVFGAANASSYSTLAAPATWISVFGENLSATTRSWTAADFTGDNLPTALDGVSVLVNGIPAYLSYISPGQINAMLPDDGSTGQVSVQVTNSQGASGALPVEKAVYSPALFRLSVEQGLYVIAQTTDGDLVGNSAVGDDLGLSVNVRGAKPGEIVTLYGTGFGPTDPLTPSGTLVGAPAVLASPVAFRIGGMPATVEWAGIIGPGLYQFNVQVPLIPISGDMVIVATIGGYHSPGDSLITVQRPYLIQ
jgi:uncharacterized protein (TIGR03437 family)